MKVTPLRVSIAVVVVGLLIVVGGLLLGDAPTQTTVIEPTPVDGDVSPDIIPDLGSEPEIVRGSPGSREQVALLGGLIVALGALGILGSVSATASRKAREEREEREAREASEASGAADAGDSPALVQ